MTHGLSGKGQRGELIFLKGINFFGNMLYLELQK
jgi:hypothetical protein